MQEYVNKKQIISVLQSACPYTLFNILYICGCMIEHQLIDWESIDTFGYFAMSTSHQLFNKHMYDKNLKMSITKSTQNFFLINNFLK